MKYKHYLAAMTAAALLLTGCQPMQAPAPEEDIRAQVLAETQPAPDTTPLTNIVRCDPVTAPDDLSSIWLTARTKDGYGAIAQRTDDQEVYLRFSDDLQTAESFVLTPPADQGDFSFANAWYALENGEIWAIAVMEGHGGLKPYDPQTDRKTYDWEAWNAAEQKEYLLCRYAENGTLVSAVPANALLDYRTGDSAYEQFADFVCADGVLYLTLEDGRVLQIDKETAAPTEIAALSGDDAYYKQNILCFDRDNKPMQFLVQEGGLTPDATDFQNQYIFREYDLVSGTPGKTIFSDERLARDAWFQCRKGLGDYRIFIGTGRELIGIRDDGSQEVLIDMDASDLYNMEVVPVDETHFLGFQYYGDDAVRVFRLTRRHESELRQAEVLTIGVLGDAQSDVPLYALVKEFNRTHEGYRIEFDEYPVNYDSEETLRASEDSFRQALLSGHAPDIVMLRNHDEALSCGKPGALLDLHTLMDRDALFGRDRFVPNVLTALEAPDGSLYGMPRTFQISTIAVKKKFCDKENWTFDDLLALYENAGENVYRWQTKQGVFLGLMEGMPFADENGSYRFDSPEFIRLLKFADRFPLSFDSLKSSYADADAFYLDEFLSRSRDEALFSNTILAGMGSMSACSYAYAKYYTFGGEDITLVGFPDGHGGKVQTFEEIAVTAHTQHPEIAWEFVKTYLQQKHAEGEALSVLNDRFEQELDDCMHIHAYAGEKEPAYYEDDGMKIYPLTQAEREDAERYIRSCKELVPARSDEVMNIAIEEADKYFSGSQTAEETAAAVQKHVQRLLAEHP